MNKLLGTLRTLRPLVVPLPNYSNNAKFWCAPIGRNRSGDAIVSLLNGQLSAHSARF